MSRRLSAPPDYAALLDKYDTWMFDCDGVLWQGDKLIDGAVEVLRLLRERKKQVLFVTNNATKSRKSYKTKFDHLGVEAHVDEIYGSAYATAVYISSVLKLAKEKKVYVIGMAGLEEELRDEGVAYIGGTAQHRHSVRTGGRSIDTTCFNRYFFQMVLKFEFLLGVGITLESEITGPNASTIVPDYVTSSIGDFRSA
ncbi:hypothetical protein HHX47_DHR5001071 [Lentinula edodes]|nr:hypothetical protein HHX47_DHR5001071 [Lentinula edodes]